MLYFLGAPLFRQIFRHSFRQLQKPSLKQLNSNDDQLTRSRIDW